MALAPYAVRTALATGRALGVGRWAAAVGRRAVAAGALYSGAKRAYDIYRGVDPVLQRLQNRGRKRYKKGSPKSSVKVHSIRHGGSIRGVLRKGRGKKKPTSLKIKVKKLAKAVKSLTVNTTTNTIKYVSTGQTTSAINQCGYSTHFVGNYTALETVANTDLRQIHVDDATGTVEEVVSTGLANSDGKVHFKKIRMTIVIRNNFHTPCQLKVYHFECKDDTSESPTGLLTEEQTNNWINVTAITSPAYYLSQGTLLRKYWKSLGVQTIMLNPGEQTTLVQEVPGFVYDGKAYDLAAISYRRKNTRCLVWRQQGVVCHDDTTETLVGIANTSLDYIVTREYVVELPGGAQAVSKVITANETYGAVTTASFMGSGNAEINGNDGD